LNVANVVRNPYSNTAGNTPSSLGNGQLGVNQADGRIFYRSAAGAVATFSSIASFATTASFPAVGLATVLYLASDTSRLHQFTGGVYVEVGVSGGGGGSSSYTLPNATTSSLGGMVVGAGLSVSSGTVSANVVSVAGRTGTVAISSSDVSGLGSLATQSSVAYSSLTGTPSSFAPNSHASSHARDGADAVTPSSIGAAAATDARLTKTIARFTARENYPPATNFATLDTRNSVLVLEFDAATEESATFIGVIPENASLASGLTVRLWWMGDTATSGNVRWGVQLEGIGTDLDADSYDTNAQVTSSANGTSGIESVASITITTIDSLAAGDRFRLRVYRVAADATNDTMTGDAQLVALEVRAA
jgi:hypothetical protein